MNRESEERRDPQREIAHLRQEIEKHNHRYHVLDDPTISDAEYDQLFSGCLSWNARILNMQVPIRRLRRSARRRLRALKPFATACRCFRSATQPIARTCRNFRIVFSDF